jgi:negative regulator of flagellin synthesis FlgM
MPINNVTGVTSAQAQRATEGSKVEVSRSEPTAQQQETGGFSTTMDSVSLTDTAARMQKLENTIAELPVVDTQRVEEIRNAIANGEYEINAENIAEKMLGLDAALNG